MNLTPTPASMPPVTSDDMAWLTLIAFAALMAITAVIMVIDSYKRIRGKLF